LQQLSIEKKRLKKHRPEESRMIVQEPIAHWNNFSVPELKAILEHCKALERLGIAQDKEMMASIERDIRIREKKMVVRHARLERGDTKIKEKHKPFKINQENMLEQTA
jgi:hypothetical protein